MLQTFPPSHTRFDAYVPVFHLSKRHWDPLQLIHALSYEYGGRAKGDRAYK
jgi:hypothetical protein